MMRLATRAAIACAFVLTAAPVFAQEPGQPNVEGCQASPLISRMPGCQIYECEKKDFDAFDVIINKAAEMKSLEGAVDHAKFACPANVSKLQLQRNLEAALQKAGYKTVFSGKHENSLTPRSPPRKARSGSSCSCRTSTSFRSMSRPRCS